MQIVHLGQSCVLTEIGTARLLLDPGVYSAGFEQLAGLDAILVTHQHPDHLDLDRLPALLAGNPAAQLLVDVGSAQPLADAGIAHRVVSPGEPGLAVPIHQAILVKPDKHYDLFRELAPVGTEVHVAPHGEVLKL
jgi:L-ascorbate metabolism protein UlaG (beta-lactamase superfamily)